MKNIHVAMALILELTIFSGMYYMFTELGGTNSLTSFAIFSCVVFVVYSITELPRLLLEKCKDVVKGES